MIFVPILNCPNRVKECHVCVDTSGIAMGTVLTQPSAGDIDHPVTFASRELPREKNNYANTKKEGLDLVHAVQKFQHYLLEGQLNIFTSHLVLNFLVNKTVLGGKLHRWLLVI